MQVCSPDWLADTRTGIERVSSPVERQIPHHRHDGGAAMGLSR